MDNKNIIDITLSVKHIENLKSKILSDIARVFAVMAENGTENVEISCKLAEVIVNSYILAKKLGFNYDEVQENINNRLKLAILSEDGISDYNELSDWLKSRDGNGA
ncbi:MAG: MazG-like family protein [Defluviitaleaceae bacterium]|nr:MazG-like family protein [Defluviitaleaceae bacterium]